MAQINGIEIKNFNPNAKTYNECIKNTQAIQKEIDKRSANSHLKLADSDTAGENKNRKLAKQLEKIDLEEQQRASYRRQKHINKIKNIELYSWHLTENMIF